MLVAWFVDVEVCVIARSRVLYRRDRCTEGERCTEVKMGKAHAHMRPSLAEVGFWMVDCYDGRGVWTSSHYCKNKEDFDEKVRR